MIHKRWNSPVRLNFQLIEHSNPPQNHRTKIDSHIQREPNIFRLGGPSIDKICSQTRREESTKCINPNGDPTIEVVRYSRHSTVEIDSFE
jgi:hypothetical protein